MFRKPLFWIVMGLLNVLAVTYIYYNFPKALSLLDVETTMSRSGSLQAADSLHTYLGIELVDYRQATMFSSDFNFQNYIEWKAGGKEAFREILKGDDYKPYHWYIRHFKEGETRELRTYFTPTGEIFGFAEKVPESEEGAALPRNKALAVADSLARNKWLVALDKYELLESAQVERPNGRIDHTFTYEMKEDEIEVGIGESNYRLRVVVSGERLTELKPFTRVPESFSKEFFEKYSFNMTLSMIASGLMILLYGTILIIWLVSLVRSKQLIFKPALTWAVIIGSVMFLSSLNYFSFYWFSYDTSTSANNFIFQRLLDAFMGAAFSAGTVLLVLMVAEGVTRKVFPDKVQFWRLTDKDVAATKPVLGNVIGSYLTVPLFMALTVGFYIFTANRLGWWLPSSAIVDPNLLGTLSPAISAIGLGLYAGFFEEAMFRALPLATAVIIGTKLKKPVLFLIIGLIVQAFIFSAAHANYAQQPYYFRLVELTIPSMMFAFLYLKLGLAPAIIVHFAYNAVLGSVSFFSMQAPGLWFDRIIFVILFFLPLIYIFFRRRQSQDWRTEGSTSFLNAIYRFLFVNWKEIPVDKLNKAYQIEYQDKLPAVETETSIPFEEEKKLAAQEKEEQSNTIEGYPEKVTGKKKRYGFLSLPTAMLITAFIVIIGIIYLTVDGRPSGFPKPQLEVRANEAIAIANNALEDWLGSEIPPEFTPYPNIISSHERLNYFIVSRNGKDAYEELIDNYLFEDGWRVTYKRFEGDLDERSEQYFVVMNSKGEVINVSHFISEDIEGAALSEGEARELVMQELVKFPDYQQMGIKEVSVTPRERPNRTDWHFTLSDTLYQVLETGEPRISLRVTGDYVSSIGRFIFIPEEDSRSIASKADKAKSFEEVGDIFLVLFYISGIIFAFIKFIRKEIDLRSFGTCFAVLFVFTILKTIISWHVKTGEFYPIQPFNNQLTMMLIGTVLEAVFLSCILSLWFAFARHWQCNREPKALKRSSTLPLIISGIVITVCLVLFKGEAAFIFNVIDIPKFRGALTAIPALSLLITHTHRLILVFSFLSFLFYLMEKLSSKGIILKIVAFLLLIVVGLGESLHSGMTYYTAPFTRMVLIRGIFNIFLFYFLYTVMTRLKGKYWLPVSVFLMSIYPIAGIIKNEFVGARLANILSYIIMAAIFMFLFPNRRLKKDNPENLTQTF